MSALQWCASLGSRLLTQRVVAWDWMDEHLAEWQRAYTQIRDARRAANDDEASAGGLAPPDHQPVGHAFVGPCEGPADGLDGGEAGASDSAPGKARDALHTLLANGEEGEGQGVRQPVVGNLLAHVGLPVQPRQPPLVRVVGGQLIPHGADAVEGNAV